MNIRIFNKPYWVRRFGEQRVVKGYLTSGFQDYQASLHVHPTGSDSVRMNPEGARKLVRLEGHGEIDLVTADEKTNQKGDILWYFGDWYECVSSQMHHTTLLSHFNYQFVLVPTDASRTTDTAPPVGDPKEGEMLT